MSWQQPPRSREALAAYEAAEVDRRVRPERYTLEPELAVERARRGGELDETSFVGDWTSGLEHYFASAERDGRLNARGQRMVLDSAVARLVAGARIAAAPEPPLLAEPPIVIVGGWRTGTTFLFRLLGSDPRLHAPLPAELSAPWRFAGTSAGTREELIDHAGGAHARLHLLNPTMAAVHPSGPRLAEECVLAMGTDLRNWGFTSTVRLNSYARWLATQDLGGSYERYRHALELIAHGDPRRFVLKAPAHTAELEHLAAAFPGAVLVHLHRDIVETIASGSSLFAVFRSTYSDAVDPVDVGAFQTEQTELWFRRAAAFRTSPAADLVTNIDIDYTALVRDPVTALHGVYEAAGMMPPSGELHSFVAAYHDANPRPPHGHHAYSPADFGLDADALRARFAHVIGHQRTSA